MQTRFQVSGSSTLSKLRPGAELDLLRFEWVSVMWFLAKQYGREDSFLMRAKSAVGSKIQTEA
jgi:hypothetical protein